MTILRPSPPGRTKADSLAPGSGFWLREELLHLLSLAATLAGLCITSVTLLHTMGRHSVSATIADDGLAFSALLFLVCTYTIFFELRTRKRSVSLRLERFADTLFLIALTAMVGSGFVMVYTLW